MASTSADNKSLIQKVAIGAAAAVSVAGLGYYFYKKNQTAATATAPAKGKAPVYRIVLTGGPCGGKSSALDAFTKALKSSGYDVLMCPEVPTILMAGGCRYPGLDGDSKLLLEFERNLIAAQLALENSFTSIGASTGRPTVVIFDRGCVDVAAYVPPNIWDDILRYGGWTEAELLARYDAVMHLVTAANGAEKFYTTANNATRTETAEHARELDLKMIRVWKNHKTHRVIDNSSDFAGKLKRVTAAVMEVVQPAKP